MHPPEGLNTTLLSKVCNLETAPGGWNYIPRTGEGVEPPIPGWGPVLRSTGDHILSMPSSVSFPGFQLPASQSGLLQMLRT